MTWLQCAPHRRPWKNSTGIYVRTGPSRRPSVVSWSASQTSARRTRTTRSSSCAGVTRPPATGTCSSTPSRAYSMRAGSGSGTNHAPAVQGLCCRSRPPSCVLSMTLNCLAHACVCFTLGVAPPPRPPAFARGVEEAVRIA